MAPVLKIDIESGLRLEILQAQHINELFQLVVNNRKHLQQWMPWVDSTKSKADVSNFVQMTFDQFSKNLGPNRGIFYHDILCGVAGYKPIDPINKIGQVGYWLSEQYQGLGLMTKSAAMIVKEGFEILALNRIEIYCAVDNVRSQNVAKRLGFKHEATLREHERLHNRFVDVTLFSLLKREYLNQPIEQRHDRTHHLAEHT